VYWKSNKFFILSILSSISFTACSMAFVRRLWFADIKNQMMGKFSAMKFNKFGYVCAFKALLL